MGHKVATYTDGEGFGGAIDRDASESVELTGTSQWYMLSSMAESHYRCRRMLRAI